MSKKYFSALIVVRMVIGSAFALPGSVWAAPNILLFIADDMGVETLASYGITERPPTTVNLDELAAEGVQFANAWSQPVCSPTRATILTGRYGFRTGVGRALTGTPALPEPPAKPASAAAEPDPMSGRRGAQGPGERRHYLELGEFTLPMALKAWQGPGYATAAIGKWHLGNESNGWLEHPRLAGFDHFSGPMEGVVSSFFTWNKAVNAEVSGTVGYAAIDKGNDAIAWIREQGDNPWFLWFAFNLPHPPLHLPPAETLQSDYSHINPRADPLENSPYDVFNAMIEAMDTQIGRVLDSMDPQVRENTYVIFIGDNGSVLFPGSEEHSPFRQGRSKGSVYQGGVHVPLIVTGPGVTKGKVSESLVNSTDLFASILDMAGLDRATVVPADITTDSVSFFSQLSGTGEVAPRREWVYADGFTGLPNGVADGDYAMRDYRYKLLRANGEEEFYNLEEDPYEEYNLLSRELSDSEQLAYQALKNQLSQLRSSE